jgi:uncharacterized membrane protein
MTNKQPIGVATALRRWTSALLILLAIAFGPPAFSHKGEKHQKAQSVEQVQTSGQTTAAPAGPGAPSGAAVGQETSHGMMDGMDMEMDRSNMPFFQRLYEWMGRFHPLIVHFPIAFFPAALFTAIVGRRRPAFSAPVQFLVVAGGIFAPIAAAAGWLAGMGADPEPILTYHRWLGVAVGIGGAALGVWAWRRPWEDRGAGMIFALILMTIAIAVQGFLGAGITHGMEHLMF